ncbi:MAG TPA: O-antigen ligase family protein [Solirubrobacteraceae bacterium]
MNQMATALALPRASRMGAGSRSVAALLALGLLAVGFVNLIQGTSVSLALAIAGGIALTGFLALTIRHYDTAVAVGLLLMGVVRFEPAPPDLAFAVIMAVAAMTGRFRLSRVPPVIRWIVGLLLVVNVLSLMDVVVTSEALRFLFITAYLAIFSLWLTGYVDSAGHARLVVVTWLVIAVISAVISSLALNLPLPGRSFILGTVDGGERADGFFKDPNVFGPFLIPIAVILLEQRVAPRFPKLLRMRSWTMWLALLALTLGILFSYSRAAWGNYAIALLVMLVASSLKKSGARGAMRALAVLLVTGGMAAVVLSAAGSISFLEHRAQLQSYDSQRFAAQHFGWELGWSHPVGIGPGQFQYHYPVESHSTFIRVFSEQGIFGLALWVALLLVTLVLALRNVVVGRDTHGIGSAALLGAWCGLIFNSAVVDTLHWRHLWVVAALIWASSVRGSRPVRRPARSAREPAHPRAPALPVGS